MALALLGFSANGLAQGLTTADPEGAGFSPARLERIAPWYRAEFEKNAVSGAVVAIARDGKLVTLQAIGTQDRAGKIPMKPDSIFWFASMTKPITSVAAMMLVEEGKIELTAPVAKYLPEFKDKLVATEGIDGQTGKHFLSVVPTKRPMQVIDLLRHTSGLVYPEEGKSSLYLMYGLADFRRTRTLADFVSSLAAFPLVHQPGEVWEYSWGVDVLARVVEVVSGRPFDEFLKTRLFTPLHMVDAGFYVPEDKLDRLVDPVPGGWPATWDMTKPAKLFSGGGGLVGTARDYLRFCQMLLNGGELDGARILKASTIKQMTTDALEPGTRFSGVQGQFVGPLLGTSWGLGFHIRVNPDFSLIPGAVGSYSWSGVWGEYFWIDPVNRLIGVQLIHLAPEKNSGQFRNAFRHLTYAALRVPEQPAPATSPAVPAEILSTYTGRYDFGPSLSAHDKQGPLWAFSGVGLEVGMVDGEAIVRVPFFGGPAQKAGVLEGDNIIAVADQPLKGLPIGQVIDKLRGAIDTPVRLRIVRKGQDNPLEVTLLRRPIRPPGAQIEVRVVDEKLVVEAIGPWSVLDFEKGKPVPVDAISNTEFRFGGGNHTRLAFTRDGVVFNPGPEEVRGDKVN
jgi:CubicO group peptidase (beta-lactamase class C family)